MLQSIVQRYQARVANGLKVPGPAADRELNLDELMAFSEAHYAKLMLSEMERK